MPRTPNAFSYQDPTASIADSIVRALFGDPELAAQQAQQKAEMDQRAAQAEEARAHAGYYQSQTAGQDGMNAGSASFPTKLADYLKTFQTPPMTPETTPITSVSDPRFLSDVGKPLPVAPQIDPVAQSSALAELLGAMGQAQGDKLNISDLAGMMGAFGGDDEFARRGMAAQGQSPSKDFAITPERADAIAQQGFASDLAKAMGVATINHANDIPVAQINNRDDVPVANINRASAFDVAGVKAAGSAPGFDAIQAAFPNAKMNSGLRTPEHNYEVGGVANSGHLGLTPGELSHDTDKQPGFTVQQAAARIMTARPDVAVVEALEHRAKKPDGTQGAPHWHFTLRNVGGGTAAAAKPPKMVSVAEQTMINNEVATWLANHDFTKEPKTAEGRRTKSDLRARAISIYQRTGNPTQAVIDAAAELKIVSAKKKASAFASAPPKAAQPKKARTGGVPTLKTDAQADAFVSNPANRGRSFIGPDGKSWKVP